MSGPLTQSLANLTTAMQQVAAVQSLPPDASTVRDDATSQVATISADVGKAQGAISTFVQRAPAELKAIELLLQDPQKMPQVKAALTEVLAQVATLTAATSTANSAIGQSTTNLFSDFQKFNDLQASYAKQLLDLQAQVRDQQAAIDDAQRQYDAYSALAWISSEFDPAVLAQLGDVLINKQGELSDMNDQLTQLNGNISVLTGLNTSVQQLSGAFKGVTNASIGLNNAVLAVSVDLQGIHDNLATKTPQALGLLVAASLTDVGTLSDDAS